MSNFKDASLVWRGVKRLIDGHIDYRYHACCSRWRNSSLRVLFGGAAREVEVRFSAALTNNTAPHPDTESLKTQDYSNIPTPSDKTNKTQTKTLNSEQINPNLKPKSPFSDTKKHFSTTSNITSAHILNHKYRGVHVKSYFYKNYGKKYNENYKKGGGNGKKVDGNDNKVDENYNKVDENYKKVDGNGKKVDENDNKDVENDKDVENKAMKSKTRSEDPVADSSSEPELAGAARESKVPGTRFERLIGFGGLGASLAFDALSSRALSGLGFKKKDQKTGAILDNNPFLSASNAEKIVATLCRMRGAALKIGQMLSIQDNSLISPHLASIFERVRQSADFMPVSQMEGVMTKELGEKWMDNFEQFSSKPFAAASIGQVHKGVTKDGRVVAVKIQYPGVANSINSDINNLVTLLNITQILPEGLYAKTALKVARKELSWECDYVREARASEKFRSLVQDDTFFYVPEVLWELTSKEVLTTEMVRGVPLDELIDKEEEIRNKVCLNILELCLKEVFSFRFMQTDPNWSNFLFDDVTQKISLIDFGASRGFESRFTNPYMELISAASKGDKETVLVKSREMNFLTGFESKVMEEAHVDAVMILGEAFSLNEPFNFGKQSTAKRIHHLIPVMLRHRLTPPPEETYSLHRKMAGCFLLCSKLRANINCQPMFNRIVEGYKTRIGGGG